MRFDKTDNAKLEEMYGKRECLVCEECGGCFKKEHKEFCDFLDLCDGDEYKTCRGKVRKFPEGFR